MPDKAQQLWEYVNQDKNRFLKLNEEGKKVYLQYGWDNKLLNKDQLTDKSMSYINTRKKLSLPLEPTPTISQEVKPLIPPELPKKDYGTEWGNKHPNIMSGLETIGEITSAPLRALNKVPFLDRMSSQAANTVLMNDFNKLPEMKSKVANVAADIGGTIAGYGVGLPQVNTSLMTVSDKLVGQKAGEIAGKATKNLTPTLGKAIERFASGGARAGSLAFMEGEARGIEGKDLAKKIGTEALIGGGLNVGIGAVGDKLKQVKAKKDIDKLYRYWEKADEANQKDTNYINAEARFQGKPIEPLLEPISQEPAKQALKPILEPPEIEPILKQKPSGAYDKVYTATVDKAHAIAKVSPEAEIMTDVTRSSRGTVDHVINKGLVDMGGKKIEGKAIADIFKLPQAETEALETLLFETHNIDRVAQSKALTGHTADESKAIIEQINKQYPNLAEKAKDVNVLLKNLLKEWGVKSGLVDENLGNLLEDMYPNYVPGYRELAGVDAVSYSTRGMGTAKVINKAVGGEEALIPLSKSIPMQINKMIRSARKNELYQEILKAAKKGSTYAKILDATDADEEAMQKAAQKAIESVKADGIEAVANLADKALTTDAKLGYMLTVMEKGKPVKLQITKELFDSLKSLGGKPDDELQAALGLFKKTVTNPFKALVTGYNPIFAVKNIFYDTPTAYIQGTENNPIKFVGHRVNAVIDMLKKADRFTEYQALGGESGNYFDIEKGINPEKFLGGKVEKVLDKIGAFNNFTETVNRYAEYLGTLKREGTDYATKMKALHNAAEVTVNFSRHGEVTKAIDAVVPYLNPAVQGVDKLGRTLAQKPEAWAKAVIAITVPTAGVYALNQMADKEGYDRLDNRTKDTMYVFPMGNGKFVKVPKNRESSVLFGALFERLFRAAEGQEDAFKGFSNTVKNELLFDNPFDENIASPITKGLKHNKDFADRTIVPNYMLSDKRSPKLQYDEMTSELSKYVGDKFNISPKQMDYIIKSYTGIVGSVVLAATTKSKNTMQEVVKRPFTADASYHTEILNDFYRKIDTLKNAATDKNIMQGLPSKLLTPEERTLNIYTGMTKTISDIRDGITAMGETEEARQKRMELLDIVEKLNKNISDNDAKRLKNQLQRLAMQMRRI